MKFPRFFRQHNANNDGNPIELLDKEPDLLQALDNMIKKGYIIEGEDGILRTTQKGDDWFYSDAWTSEQRRIVMGNDFEDSDENDK